MTKSKTTKRALLSSCVALMLCFSMLLGTTYAWFTDEVTSQNNIIQSGTLDATLEWSNENLDETSDKWIDASTGAIFNYQNWEPGYTEVKYVKVANVGTLAFKYQLNIIPNVLPVAGEYNLADVIDVYVNVGARSDLTAANYVGTLSELMADPDGAAYGYLLPVSGHGDVAGLDPNLIEKGSVQVAIALKMQEDAGNNYQNLSVGEGFSVQLLATQLTYERDSFGPDYDEDADYAIRVTTDAELLAAIQNPAETYIIVDGDLTYDWGGESYENSKALLMKGKTFSGNDADASITFAGYGSANPIKNVTLKNITIKDTTVGDDEKAWEHGYLEFEGLKAMNVTFADSIMLAGDSTLTNCSFNSGKDNEYAVWVSDGDASFENCDFTGARGLKVHEAYGSEVDSVKVNNSTFANLTKKPGVAIGDVNADTSISLTNNMFVGTQPGDQGNYKYESDTDTTKFNFVDDSNTVAAEATVSTAGDLIAALNDPNATSISLELADNIEFEKITTIEPGKDVYLNLNGKTITVDKNTPSNTLLYVKEGAKLTIDGNGIIDLGSVSTMAIFAPYGELVIENGTFIRDEVTTVTNKTTGLFMGAKSSGCNVTINGGYFDPGYYDENAANIEDILAGTATFTETTDDIAKRGNSGDKNLVRVAVKDNVSVVLNHSGYGSFKVYGGTFVGANPAWGDEGCMLPTTPKYLRPWSYYQGALLDGQTFHEYGIVLPAGYTITKGTTDDGIPTYTVAYSEQ